MSHFGDNDFHILGDVEQWQKKINYTKHIPASNGFQYPESLTVL